MILIFLLFFLPHRTQCCVILTTAMVKVEEKKMEPPHPGGDVVVERGRCRPELTVMMTQVLCLWNDGKLSRVNKYYQWCLTYLLIILFCAEGDVDEEEEEEEEDQLLSEMEVEQAPPVVPIPAPVEPPVKRKRGRPPKNKPQSKCWAHFLRPVDILICLFRSPS